MLTTALDYNLPPERIAAHPVSPRDAARLLVAIDDSPVSHHHVRDLDTFLEPGDCLILNRTEVLPGRLLGTSPSGGAREILLIHRESMDDERLWRAMVRGKVHVGSEIFIASIPIRVEALHEDGTRTIRFPDSVEPIAFAKQHGHIPLPPYIRRADNEDDKERYQTVFADRPGSIAAPTAGLHFTPELLQRISAKGVNLARVDLCIGPGTFKPIETDTVEDFAIHPEWCRVPAETIAAAQTARQNGKRIIAIGTTSVRALESAWRQTGGPAPFEGWTRIFLYPPQEIQSIDALMTNFHLPRSSLMTLVACITGLERLHELYALAIKENYRFYSYGDAMLVGHLGVLTDPR